MKILWKYTLVALAIGAGFANGSGQEKNSLIKLDPALDVIVPAGTKLEKLIDDGQFREGPVWVQKGREGYLLFSNLDKGSMQKWSATEGGSVFFPHPANQSMSVPPEDEKLYASNGITLDHQGRVVFCAPNVRSVMRIEKDGERTVLAERYEGKRLTEPNDIVYKSDGALYFTDMLPQAPGDRDDRTVELPPAVYLLKNGSLQPATRELEHPNGLAFSPDEKYLYVNDSTKRIVWRFEVKADDTLVNGHLFLDMHLDPARGVPDGIKVDHKGNIYDSGPAGLWFLSAEGKHLGTLITPERVSNLAFGDADGRTLFITLHSGLYRIKLKIPGIRPSGA